MIEPRVVLNPFKSEPSPMAQPSVPLWPLGAWVTEARSISLVVQSATQKNTGSEVIHYCGKLKVPALRDPLLLNWMGSWHLPWSQPSVPRKFKEEIRIMTAMDRVEVAAVFEPGLLLCLGWSRAKMFRVHKYFILWGEDKFVCFFRIFIIRIQLLNGWGVIFFDVEARAQIMEVRLLPGSFLLMLSRFSVQSVLSSCFCFCFGWQNPTCPRSPGPSQHHQDVRSLRGAGSYCPTETRWENENPRCKRAWKLRSLELTDALIWMRKAKLLRKACFKGVALMRKVIMHLPSSEFLTFPTWFLRQ